MSRAATVMTILTWDERPYQELDGASKLTRASVGKTYSGDIAGDATFESLMFYRPDGSADFVGLERVAATIDGRTGSFVLRIVGGYADGTAKAECTVVTDSGTGELRGLRGAGRYAATHAEFPHVQFTLEYSLDAAEA